MVAQDPHMAVAPPLSGGDVAIAPLLVARAVHYGAVPCCG